MNMNTAFCTVGLKTRHDESKLKCIIIKEIDLD